jgi:tetratricopeptide (TPR) repeat protein
MPSKAVFYIILLAVPLFLLGADAKSWEQWMAEGAALKNEGKYPEAVYSFERALRIADEFQVQDRRLLYTINALASAYAQAGRIAESAYQYQRGISLLDKSGGRESVDYALLLGSLASIRPERTDTNIVVTILQKVIAARQGTDEQIFSLQDYLFQIYKDTGRYREAELVVLDEQATAEKRNEKDSISRAILLNNLGALRSNTKRYQEAIELYRESLRIREANGESDSPK